MDLIVAVDNNWAIGNKGDLLVSIPEDHKFFRQTTMGNVVVLGRKTLAGFPNGLPLAGRDNIILSTDPNYTVRGGTVVHSKEELFEELKKYEDKEIFVIGGGQIFPKLDELENWEMIADSDEHTYFDLEFYFHKYENKNPLAF